MTQLLVREQNIAQCCMCPYCSKLFDITTIEERNDKQVGVPDLSKAPVKCDRCGSPMEPGKEAQKFQNQMAEKAKDTYGPNIGLLRTLAPKAGPVDDMEGGDDDDSGT